MELREIVEEIKTKTVVEINELVKMLEEGDKLIEN